MSKRANGEGSIYRRSSDGRWCAAISVDGRRKYFHGERREDVAKKLANALKTRQDGLPLPGERQTVAQHLTSDDIVRSLTSDFRQRCGTVAGLRSIRRGPDDTTSRGR